MMTQQIDIDKIIMGERARHDFGDIDALAKSISEIGLLQPILVSMGTGDPLLVDGHRRILAYKKLGLKTIPAVIFDTSDLKTYRVSRYLQAEYDANMVRKDFTPSEMVWLSDKIKHWIETSERFEKDKQEAQNNTCANFPPNINAGSEPKSLSEGKKTRDKVADVLGISARTLAKARVVVESAAENPENADLVKKMDETRKVDPVYKELQTRKQDNGNLPPGKSAGLDNLPKGKVVSLIVKMPDGRQKKMGSISTEWFQNENVLQWIIKNVGLGVDEKDIVIHREGNIVKIFDSTNVEGLKQGIRYLMDKYSFQGCLMDAFEKERNENLSG